MNKPFITYKEENEQLRDKVRELEEENAHLKQSRENFAVHAEQTLQQLAASQAYAEQLRKALEGLKPLAAYGRVGTRDIEQAEFQRRLEVLTAPRDTSALDAYVAEKVKEIIESHAPEGRNVTNAQHVEMRHKFVEQISTLTRQRDLAVEAASDAATSLETIQLRSFGEESYLDSKPQMRAFAGARAKIARDILSTIKESDGK